MRPIILFCCLGMFASLLAAQTVPITLRVTRLPAFSSKWTTCSIYLNDELVGKIANNEHRIFTVTNAKVGKNKLSIVDHTLFGPFPFYINPAQKYGNVKTFVVWNSGEVIELKFGFNDDNVLQNHYQVTNEISEGAEPAKVLKVALNKQLKSIKVKESPPIRLVRGTSKLVEDTLRVKHEVKISTNWKVAADVKAAVQAIWGSVNVHVRTEIERSTNRVSAVESERKRSVILTGDGSTAVKVVWVEYYRTGIAKVQFLDKVVDVPFEFRDDFDLVTAPAD